MAYTLIYIMEYNMAQKRVNITINEQLNERWNKAAKKHDISKSGMVTEFLLEVLPILEESTPNKMMAKAMKQMSEQIDTTATLFDQMSYDESVEDYKKNKLG
jgi:hypothetical protein